MTPEQRAIAEQALADALTVVPVIELAPKIGTSRAAIYMWKIVPVGRVLEIEGHTNIPRQRLRPDFYPT